ncbi:MAG: hypothetical protein ACLQUZ_01925 [Rhizomicrobium sp.]
MEISSSTHPDLPGQVGRTFNEHYARQFDLHWRDDMLAEEEAA